MNLEELKRRQNEAYENAQAIIARAEGERRDISDDEQKEIDNFTREFDALDDRIKAIETVNRQGGQLATRMGRQTEPEPGNRLPTDPQGERIPPEPQRQPQNGQPPQKPRVESMENIRRNGGFRNLGDFAQSVRAAARPGAAPDPRLLSIMNAPTTYGSEGVGADGGFAVPPDFRTEIMSRVFGEEALVSRTDQVESTSNSFTVPKDETTPWQSTGGIQAYWEGEGALKTQSKPALEELTIKLNKLVVLVPVTDELLEDAPGLTAYLRKKAPEKMDFKINLAILQGTGVGQPLGILNSPATVSVAKESGQAADTIVWANVRKMWSRLHAPARARAVWLVSQSSEEQLSTMQMAVGTGGVPVYMPASGVSGSPFSTLYGRPVVPTQAAEQLGDKGDIILGDLSQYLVVKKTGGIRSEVSIHLWFDYDVTAFRFVLRLAGQPWWNKAIDPRDGSTTMGAFVTLDERA